jgi:hypothetical protein
MSNGLDLTRFNLAITLHGNLNALRVDLVITRGTRISDQAFPRHRRETLSLCRRESQYFFLKVSVHETKYNASGMGAQRIRLSRPLLLAAGRLQSMLGATFLLLGRGRFKEFGKFRL